MKIEANIKKDYVHLFLENGCTLDDFLEYQHLNKDLLRNSHALLDFRAVDFSNAYPEEMISYIKGLKKVYENIDPRKRALLHDTERGLVASRVFKYLAGNNLNLQFQIFSDLNNAVDWLCEN